MTLRRFHNYVVVIAVTIWSIWLVDMSVAGSIDRLGKVKGTDFIHFYVMGSIVRDGAWEQLFDPASHVRRAQDVAPGSPDIVYLPVESPQLALAFSPFARFRYPVALGLWLAAVSVLYLFSSWLVWRDCPALFPYRATVAAACIGFPGLYSEVLHGQVAILALMALAVALYALRRGRRFLGGLSLGCLVFKPHWVLAAGAVFVFAREWRIVAGIVTAALTQIAATSAAVGLVVMERYWQALRAIPTIAGLLEPQPSDSLRGLFKVLVRDEPAAVIVYLIAACATLVVAAKIWRSGAPPDVGLSAAVLAMILICPHVNAYDLLLLLPVFLFLTNWLASSDHENGRIIAVCLLVLAAAPFVGALPALLKLQFSVTTMLAILFCLSRALPEPRARFAPLRP